MARLSGPAIRLYLFAASCSGIHYPKAKRIPLLSVARVPLHIGSIHKISIAIYSLIFQYIVLKFRINPTLPVLFMHKNAAFINKTILVMKKTLLEMKKTRSEMTKTQLEMKKTWLVISKTSLEMPSVSSVMHKINTEITST